LKNPEKPSLDLFLEGNWLSSFNGFLQCGIKLKARVGISIHTILTQELGLKSADVEKIETVFLDGKTVDDLDASLVKDGSIVALSSAMPGLVGATLRRGSFYAAMRSQITDAGAADSTVPRQGMVTLKLFNLVIKELGPVFLKRGIWLPEEALHDFLVNQPPEFWGHCKEARVNGEEVAPGTLLERRLTDAEELICLRVEMRCPETAGS